jgi:hypothetical protein
MSTHTDSQIIEHHDDGSWTTTTVVTETPATKKQQAVALTVLVGLCVAPFTPLIAVVAAERWEARKERKRKLKSVPN